MRTSLQQCSKVPKLLDVHDIHFQVLHNPIVAAKRQKFNADDRCYVQGKKMAHITGV